MENKKKSKEVKRIIKRQLPMMIVLFLGFGANIILVTMAVIKINRYIHKEEYREGILNIDKFTYSSSGGGQGTHYGHGTVKNVYTNIGLGSSKVRIKPITGPNENTSIAFYYKENGERKSTSELGYTYNVFYRSNGKQTILKRGNETIEDNMNKQLKNGLLNLVFPFIIYPLLYIYYKYLSRKIKTIEEKEQLNNKLKL